MADKLDHLSSPITHHHHIPSQFGKAEAGGLNLTLVGTMLSFLMMASPWADPIDQDDYGASPDGSDPSQLLPDSSNGVVHVSTPTLLLSTIPLLCIGLIGHRSGLGLGNSVVVGIVRSFVQLMLLGWILHPIFVWGMDWPWIVFLCEYLLLNMNFPKTYQALIHQLI